MNKHLNVRIENILRAAELTWTDMEVLNPRELFTLRNFGRKSYNEILDRLEEQGKQPGTFSDFPPECGNWRRIEWYVKHREQIWKQVGFTPTYAKVQQPQPTGFDWEAFRRDTAVRVLCTLLTPGMDWQGCLSAAQNGMLATDTIIKALKGEEIC